MNVSRTTGVVAREDGGELRNTLGVGLLDTAEESRVQVGGVGRVTIARRGNARVDTLHIVSIHYVTCGEWIWVGGERTVALQCQRSMYTSGTGSQVLVSMSWTSR